VVGRIKEIRLFDARPSRLDRQNTASKGVPLLLFPIQGRLVLVPRQNPARNVPMLPSHRMVGQKKRRQAAGLWLVSELNFNTLTPKSFS